MYKIMRGDFDLRKIGDVDGQVFQIEIAAGIAGNICDPQTEIFVVKVAGAPGMPPCIRRISQEVGDFRGRERGRGFGRGPGNPAVPGKLHAHERVASGCVGAGIEADLKTLNLCVNGKGEIVVRESVFVLTAVCAGSIGVCAAVGIHRKR